MTATITAIKNIEEIKKEQCGNKMMIKEMIKLLNPSRLEFEKITSMEQFMEVEEDKETLTKMVSYINIRFV